MQNLLSPRINLVIYNTCDKKEPKIANLKIHLFYWIIENGLSRIINKSKDVFYEVSSANYRYLYFKADFLIFTAFTNNTLAKKVGTCMNGLRSTIGIYGFHELKLQPFLSMLITPKSRYHNSDGGEKNVT